MSMHCTITALLHNGKFRSVYCHQDGHIDKWPHGVGYMLQKYYNTPHLATEVVSNGSLKYLRPTLGETHFDVFHCIDEYCEYFDCVDLSEIYSHHEQQYNYIWNGIEWYCVEITASGTQIEHSMKGRYDAEIKI